MKSEAAEEMALKQDQIKKKHNNVIELKPSFSVYFAIKKTLITAHSQISVLFIRPCWHLFSWYECRVFDRQQGVLLSRILEVKASPGLIFKCKEQDLSACFRHAKTLTKMLVDINRMDII